MIAFFLMMLLTLVFQSILNAASVLAHANSSILMAAPLIVVVTVFCMPMLKGLLTLFFAGIIIDSLTGGLIGTNMALLVFLGFLGMMLSSWLGRPHWPMVFAFLLGASCLYRVALSWLVNFGVLNLFLGPFMDACVGLIFFYWIPRRVIKMD